MGLDMNQMENLKTAYVFFSDQKLALERKLLQWGNEHLESILEGRPTVITGNYAAIVNELEEVKITLTLIESKMQDQGHRFCPAKIHRIGRRR